MKKYASTYETGSTRISRVFIFGWKTINGKTKFGFGFYNVHQKLVLAYRKRGANQFGMIAPTPEKVWQNTRFCL